MPLADRDDVVKLDIAARRTHTTQSEVVSRKDFDNVVVGANGCRGVLELQYLSRALYLQHVRPEI